MVKRIEEHLSLFNNDLCFIIPENQTISIEEKKTEGKGFCFFTSSNPVLFIKANDKNSCLWLLKSQKCAEGAFLEFKNDDEIILHLIEMKSHCKLKTFMHACEQLEGMYFSVLSIMSILKLGEPAKVISYLAYVDESLSDKSSNPMIANKLLIGEPKKVLPMSSELEFWKKKYINRKYLKSKLITGKRMNGDYNFGLIST